jgi:hypothetical protein
MSKFAKFYYFYNIYTIKINLKDIIKLKYRVNNKLYIQKYSKAHQSRKLRPMEYRKKIIAYLYLKANSINITSKLLILKYSSKSC